MRCGGGRRKEITILVPSESSDARRGKKNNIRNMEKALGFVGEWLIASTFLLSA